MSSAEQLLVNVISQMPFVALLYWLFTNERAERIKSNEAQISSLQQTIAKSQERHAAEYDRACKLYEKFLDESTMQLRAERNRRTGGTASKTDIHDTQNKIGL